MITSELFSYIEITDMLFNFTSVVWVALALMMAVTVASNELTERQSPVKIMALGDSITGSPVCILMSADCYTVKTDLAKGLLARFALAEASTSRYQEHRFRRYVGWTRLRISI
jgi:hypothetical protein